MNYLEKIKQLNQITTSSICKDLKIDYCNLLNGRTTKENEKKVYNKLIEEYKKIIKDV